MSKCSANNQRLWPDSLGFEVSKVQAPVEPSRTPSQNEIAFLDETSLISGMVKNLFSTRVYAATLVKKSQKSERNFQEMVREIKQIQATDIPGQKWSHKNYPLGYTSYGSMDRLDRFSTTFQILEKQIHQHVVQFSKALHWDVRPQDLVLNSMWVNVMPAGAHHSFHIHPHSVVSGTYYVKTPKSSSVLQFEDPRLTCLMASPPLKKTAPLEEKNHYSHQPVDGEVVLFESWLRHQVPAQKPKSERISISFNYSWNPRRS